MRSHKNMHPYSFRPIGQDEINQDLKKVISISTLSLDAQISADSLDQLLSLVDGHADAWVEEVVDHGDQVGLVMAVTQSNGGRA